MSVLTLRTWLEEAALPREPLARFLDPDSPTWAKHDPELGYRLSNIIMKDGVDGCRSIYSYEPNGARRIVNYPDRPCRINTFGNSFTQCHQVSDGETWQEILAAHFGEPIRNFGVGGYGVYQAYRRMKRVEPTADGAPCVMLNIYDDDHRRNLMACRWLHISRFYSIKGNEAMFHNMPWVHVRFDLSTGKWIECANPFDTSESLYRLCDPAFMYETYRNDPVVKLEMLRHGAQAADLHDVHELADHFQAKLDLTTPESIQRTSWELLIKYSLRSTMFVVDQAQQYLASRGKKLMVLLSYGSGNVASALQGKSRFDQSLVEYLKGTGLALD